VKFQVIVKDQPKADFTFTHTGCTKDTVYFSGPDTTAEGYTINRWKWTFPGPVADSGQQVKHVFPAGSQAIKLSVISAEGCVSDSVRTITIYPPLVADFVAKPSQICEGSSVTLSDNSSYSVNAAIKTWYWDWVNGVTA